MLATGKTVLLLSQDIVFIERYQEIAKVCDFTLEVRNKWYDTFRSDHDVIVADTDFIKHVSVVYRDKLVAVYSGSHNDMYNIADRFIFNKDSIPELMYSVMKIKVMDKPVSDRATAILKAGKGTFITDKYNFDFASNTYVADGVPVHFTDGQATALAKWLLLGIKDNNCNVQLHALRKKLGREFLSDINKFGEVRDVRR